MPSVSFVVNAFGKAAYLPLVLPALRAQEGGFEREIIVLDGGSPDGPGRIARELTRDWPEVRVLEHEDRGPSNAINTGAAAARLEYLHCIDGDDVLAPYATSLLLGLSARLKAPTVVSRGRFYADPAELQRGFDRAAAEAAPARVPDDPLMEIIRYAPSNMSGTLIRRDLFERIGGCDERVFIHDYSLTLRAALAAPLALSEAVTWLGPRHDQQRIMLSGKRQLMHDFSAAAYYLLLDHPELPLRYRRMAFRRIAGRAYKWARREEGLTRPSIYSWLFLRSYVPWLCDIPRALQRSMTAFELSKPVRR